MYMIHYDYLCYLNIMLLGRDQLQGPVGPHCWPLLHDRHTAAWGFPWGYPRWYSKGKSMKLPSRNG